jgi:hypothetical protein
VDLRTYSTQLQNELRDLERESIEECKLFIEIVLDIALKISLPIDVLVTSVPDYNETSNLTELHNQILSCDSVLANMSDLLGGFREDLGKISNEIKHLQEESYSMNNQLKNRQTLEAQISPLLTQTVLPPELIRYFIYIHTYADFLNTF